MSEEVGRRWSQAVRVLEMVSALHACGLKRIRIMPYLHPLAWRVLIGPCEAFDRDGIMVTRAGWDDCAGYSAASGASCFGWGDAGHDDAVELAVKFTDRFPGIAAKGAGRDDPYAAWLAGLLNVLREEQTLPLLFSDDEPYDPRCPKLALVSTQSGAICDAYPIPPEPI